MSVTLLKILADFTVQLSAPVAIGDTTANLSSANDDDGNALPTGLYGFTIDGGQSNKEYIVCTLTGTTITGNLLLDKVLQPLAFLRHIDVELKSQ